MSVVTTIAFYTGRRGCDGCVAAGEHAVPAVDPLAALHVQAGGPDHLQEHPHDAEAQGNMISTLQRVCC